MTQEDIIRMAREANIKQAIETPHLLMVHELERFAQLVAAVERERLAAFVDEYTHGARPDISAAIRERGQ